ncbi:MAG: ABC transporter permease subunit, partial [Actinomycetota bacterium]
MSDYAFYLLLGSGAGAIIAAFALGLVVTYQGSGVVNFAHGAMAMWSTYVYADLRNGAYPIPIPGLPYRYHFSGDVGLRLALLITMLTAAVIGFVVYALVFRPLRRAPALAKVVASIGLVIMFISLVDRRFADQTALRVKPILPREPVAFTESITVPRDGLWLATVVVLLCAFFWLVGKFTRVGLATKAAAENEKAAVLLGYSPDRLAALGWVMASMSGALVGVLASPQLQLNGTVYTFGFLIPALGAALIGKFQRFWPTLLAGMAIGMVQSTFTKMQSEFAWFPEYGAREGLPFLVIIVTMVVLGERLPERGSVTGWKLPSVPAARLTPVSFVVPFAVAIAALFLLGPLWRAAIRTTVVAAVLSLSMVVLVGFGGQTSLAQMAFAGVAGFALSKLATDHGVPFPLAPLLAATGAALFGVLVGLPALRVRGTNLAIVTLAGGVMVAEFVFKNPDIIGDVQSGGAKVPNPSLGSWDFGLILGDKTSRPIFGVFLV